MSLLFTEIADHLWAAPCRALSMNTGIALDGPHAALIDPALLVDEIEDIAVFCDSRGAQVESVVLTHHHWDHILGAARFAQAQITAHRTFTAECVRELDRTRNILGQFHGVTGGAPSFTPPVPGRVVDGIVRLTVGDSHILLFHTPGHARDHLSVYDPDTCFLWAGDLLSDREIPFISDRLDAYERTLGMLAAMDVRTLVPGHGCVTADVTEIRDRIDADRSYLADLRARVQRAVDAGRSMDEAVAACTDMAFRFPEDNRDPHVMNVEQVFAELGGHVAPGRISGWAREP